ncbi:MAG: hypothetical protein WBR18_13365 [Anaerolineales bacterium]
MSTTWKAILISSAAVIVILGLVMAGFALGRMTGIGSWGVRNGSMMGPAYAGSMMDWDRGPQVGDGGYHMGPGAGPMMGGYGGMMDGYDGMMDEGWMMGGGPRPSSSNVDPLDTAVAKQAVESYLENAGYDGLEVREVMVFDNHAYVEVAETETGIGAMELLVDPETLAVYPEYGPNMMWNEKYGHMGGYRGGMGMMMGGYDYRSGAAGGEMEISGDQAVELAQAYLDRAQPGATADEPEAFYGYYTLHVLRDGEVQGMLSVHGTSGDVFPHTWHGALVTMTEE